MFGPRAPSADGAAVFQHGPVAGQVAVDGVPAAGGGRLDD